jgi:hypothetical protein
MGVVRNLSPPLAVLIAVLMTGCSDPYAGRLAVSGTVKLKGELLKSGIIAFEPLEKQDTASGAPIDKGSYNIPRDKGLKPGKYRIRVTAGDGVTPAMIPGAAAGKNNEEEAAGPGRGTNIISKDLIPPSWGSNSQQEVTVAEGKTRFDFDIPAK